MRKKKQKKLTNVSLVCMYVGRKSEMSVFSVFFPNRSNLSTISMVAWEKTEKCQFLCSMYVCKAKTDICQFFFCFFFVHLPLRRKVECITYELNINFKHKQNINWEIRFGQNTQYPFIAATTLWQRLFSGRRFFHTN